MRVLIDGYNLCHFWGLLLPRAKSTQHAGPHELERARLQLLGRLIAESPAGASITVVFDAAGAPPGLDGSGQHKGIEVIYALRGTADDRIEDLIQHDSDPRRLSVVSDDRRIKDAARRRHCQVLGCEQFEAELARQSQQKRAQTKPQLDKPEATSEKETREWLDAFGAVDKETNCDWPDWEKG